MKKSVIVYVKGGIVQDIEASEDMNVFIVDFDTEGSEDNELGKVFHTDGKAEQATIDISGTTKIRLDSLKTRYGTTAKF